VKRVACVLLGLAGLVSARAAGPPVALEIAVPWPEQTVWCREMLNAAERVASETRGRARVRVLHGTVATNVLELGVYGLPLRLAARGEVPRIHEAMDGVVESRMAERGYVSLGIRGLGLAYVFSTREIRTPEGFEQARVWIPDAGITNQARAYGIANPVAVAASDVRKALRDGTVDTLVTMPAAVVVGRWHTSLKQVVDMPFMYLATALAVPREPFERLSADDQATARRVLGDAFRLAAANCWDKNEESLALLRSGGALTFRRPDAEQMAAWQAWSDRMLRKALNAHLLPEALVTRLDRALGRGFGTPAATNAVPANSTN
jgi:TRAP-type C4-dicarboxylate transport system substrate-binding protein